MPYTREYLEAARDTAIAFVDEANKILKMKVITKPHVTKLKELSWEVSRKMYRLREPIQHVYRPEHENE